METESRFMQSIQNRPAQWQTDIIIPVWNQSRLTVACLRSIRLNTQDYRLIVIDNGSAKDEWQPVEDELKLHRSVLVIKNSVNVGFVKAVNQGIAQVTAPYTVFMNNDTEAVAGWIQKLVTPLRVNNRILLSGPLTTTTESWQGKYPKNRHGWILRERGMLAFFCTLFRSDSFKIIGTLDEQFGVGFGDDDDYCMRVIKAGYKMALVQDLIIPHHHRSTFKQIYSGEVIKAMQDSAIEKFRTKHNIEEN